MANLPYVDPTQKKTLYQQAILRIAKLRPVTWFLVNLGPKIDPILMGVSNGYLKLGPGTPTVILYNRGAKSGKLRKTPVIYFNNGDDAILIASKGGAASHPAWLYNVKANPEVELWVGNKGGPYTARLAAGEEKKRLWILATEFYAGFADYQKRAGDRDIHVVVCSPR